MKRLTVHVSNGTKSTKEVKNKDNKYVKVPVIKNTLAFRIENDAEVNGILDLLKKDKIVVTKSYLSNIN